MWGDSIQRCRGFEEPERQWMQMMRCATSDGQEERRLDGTTVVLRDIYERARTYVNGVIEPK